MYQHQPTSAQSGRNTESSIPSERENQRCGGTARNKQGHSTDDQAAQHASPGDTVREGEPDEVEE